MSDAGANAESTYFAPAGRVRYKQLADQMRRTLEDPCVKTVLESVSGFVMILNRERQVVAANQELLDALGRREEGCVVGLRPGEVFNCIHFTEGPDGCGTSRHCRACGAVLAILASQNSDAPATEECRLSAFRDGRVVALEMRVRATPLQIADEQFTIFVLQDISALKRREVLERTFLDDFLGMVGGIVGLGQRAQTMDSSGIAGEVLSLADTLREEILAHRSLLEAEKGSLSPRKAEFDLVSLFSSLETLFAYHPVAEGKALQIDDPPAAIRLYTDRALLLRVLVNGLKNAFEATEPGGMVRLWYAAESVRPVFVIHNPGVIPGDTQLHIFERSFSTKHEPGHGLGTYSMKLFGERYLGGSVTFTSDRDNGTQFFIALPWEALSDHAAPDGLPAVPSSLSCRGRLLLVDDDEPVLRLGALLLARLGYFVTPCHGGPEALTVFAASPESFDAVITDYKMPDMNGIELARALLQFRADLPILLCTGMVSNPEDLAGSGIRGHIVKPFSLQELAEAIVSVVNRPMV